MDMKKILSLVVACISLSASAANPDIKAFDTNNFEASIASISIKNGGIWRSNLNQEVIDYFVSSNRQDTVIRDVLQVYPVSNGTNYWLDFGRTNAQGQTYIYQTILATNNVTFIGATNCTYGGLLSLNVVASGGNRTVKFPPNLPHLDTNNLTLVGGAYQLTLTKGNLLRASFQSNITFETLWYAPEQ
jgi:hypothetical protein